MSESRPVSWLPVPAVPAACCLLPGIIIIAALMNLHDGCGWNAAGLRSLLWILPMSLSFFHWNMCVMRDETWRPQTAAHILAVIGQRLQRLTGSGEVLLRCTTRSWLDVTPFTPSNIITVTSLQVTGASSRAREFSRTKWSWEGFDESRRNAGFFAGDSAQTEAEDLTGFWGHSGFYSASI